MSYETWPESVPGFHRDDCAIQPISTLKVRNCQDGSKEVRRFGSGAPDVVQGRLKLTTAQFATFTSFYESDCALGTLWFEAGWIQDPLGYAAGYVGRILGYTRPLHREGYKEVQVSILLQAGSLISDGS